jgi:hypothetical protein
VCDIAQTLGSGIVYRLLAPLLVLSDRLGNGIVETSVEAHHRGRARLKHIR